MKNKDKTKAELLKELEILEHRITELQKSNKQWKKSSQELKKNHLHFEQLAEKHTTTLRESKDLLDKVVNLNPDWIFIKDRNYQYILVNKGYASGVGKLPEDLIGKNDIEIGFPEELIFGNSDKGITGFRSDDKRALKGEIIHNEYNPATTADGTLHIFDTYKIPLRDSNGNIYAVLGYSRDITERKQTEEAIKESENRFRELFNHMSSGVAVYEAKDNGKDFIIKDFNRAAEKIDNIKKQDIIGKSVLKVFPGVKDFGLFKIFQEAYKTGKPQHHPISLYKDQRITGWRDNHVYKLPSGEIVAVYDDITERKQAEEKLKNTLDATIETMSKIVEVKDPYTAGHQLRVSQLTTAIAKELNLSQDKIEGIRIASLIHDIGKISVPTEILSKTTTLSDIEFSLIKGHSQIGYDILKSIDFSYPVANIILQHHERIDSSGYPNHLKGDQVLLEACIIGVADVVEAMSSHRPYRPSLGIDAALEEISKNRGILYDPEVVDACLKLFKEKEFKFDESASN